ncbi:MAG: hypothetical protein ACOX5X_00265 [Acholeplasmataceae bacterium]|jgi:hypothetical protein
MKIVWRVVYIIYATVLLLVVGSLSLARQEHLYFDNEGQKALDSKDEMEKFYFFYSSVGYHVRTIPPLIYENDEFILAFFEVYVIEEMTDIFYIMLYPKIENFQADDTMRYELAFNFGDDNRKTYNFDRFRHLQMYILVDLDRHALITTSEIERLNPTSITVNKIYAVVSETDKTVSIKTDEYNFFYNITSDDLIVGKRVEEGMRELGITKEKLSEKSNQLDDYLYANYQIYPKNFHSMKKYSYIFYLSITATIIAIVLGAYFLFFFKRGKKATMGRERPTKAFEDFGYKNQEIDDPLLLDDDLKDS